MNRVAALVTAVPVANAMRLQAVNTIELPVADVIVLQEVDMIKPQVADLISIMDAVKRVVAGFRLPVRSIRWAT